MSSGSGGNNGGFQVAMRQRYQTMTIRRVTSRSCRMSSAGGDDSSGGGERSNSGGDNGRLVPVAVAVMVGSI